MKRHLPVFILLLIIPFSGIAQKEQLKLVGEGNLETVKLLWFPTGFAPGLEGFDVKRRELNGDKAGEWKKLNSTTIVPSVDAAKDLANIDSDRENAARLKGKLEKMIAEKKVKPIAAAEFREKLQKDPEAAKGLAIGFSLDYDMALLSGFGFIDRKVFPPAVYEYGIFAVKDGKSSAEPMDVYRWKHGTKADLDLNFNIVPGKLAKSNQVELKWKFKSDEFLKKQIKGFNVYRNTGDGKFILLNPEPLMVQLKNDSTEAFFYDREAVAGQNYTYTITPLSLLETEGQPELLKYEAADFKTEIVPVPTLTEVKGTGQKPAGVIVTWTFDKAAESKITGFYVQRSDLPADFKNVSKLLPAGQRTFTDNSSRENRSYFKYRIVAAGKKQEQLMSNENIVYSETEMPPPRPRNLQGKWVKENGHFYIDLYWDAKKSNDSLTGGYRLYANFPPGNELSYKASIPLITENKYRYEVFNLSGATYKFRISAVNPYGSHSELSDTLTVFSPSQHLDNISISSVKSDTDRIVINWAYTKDVKDLAGFRIFRDGIVVADEKTLKANDRQWSDRGLKKGVTHVYEIQAVSSYGIESRKSNAMGVRLSSK